MIDVTSERVLTITEAAGLPFMPRRNGKPINITTIWRWTFRGLRGIRLETVKIGGTTCTSVEALLRFIAAQNPGTSIIRTTGQRARAIARAEAQCAAAGV